jgi:hypothetical protein
MSVMAQLKARIRASSMSDTAVSNHRRWSAENGTLLTGTSIGASALVAM